MESRYDQAFLYLSNRKRRSLVVLTNVIDEVMEHGGRLFGEHQRAAFAAWNSLRDQEMFDAHPMAVIFKTRNCNRRHPLIATRSSRI